MGNLCCRSVSEGPNLRHRSFKWHEIIAWGMIDFSNSIVLMVTISTYPSWCQTHVFDNFNKAIDSFRNMNIIVSVLLFLLSPPVGAIIDATYIRVPVLAVSSFMYAIASICLYAVKQGSEALVLAMYWLSSFGYRFTEATSGAFLPSLCNDRDMGFVSGFGYCIGFIAGVLILLILNELTKPALIPGTNQYDEPREIHNRGVAMLLLGIVEVLSVLPAILTLDNGKPPGVKREWHWKIIPKSFAQNGRTLKSLVKENLSLTLLFLNYFFYSITLQTIASYFGALIVQYGGASYGITTHDVQGTLVFYNLIVAFTSIIFGLIVKKTGALPCILFCYILAILNSLNLVWWEEIGKGLGVNPGNWLLWSTQMIGAFYVGPSQSLVRGVVGIFADPTQKSEVFGLLESVMLFASLIGSTVPSVFVKMGTRPFGIWQTVFCVISLVIVCFVPIRKAEKEARARMEQAGASTLDELAYLERKGALPDPSTAAATLQQELGAAGAAERSLGDGADGSLATQASSSADGSSTSKRSARDLLTDLSPAAADVPAAVPSSSSSSSSSAPSSSA